MDSEIDQAQTYHHNRIANLFAGSPPSTIIAIDGIAFGHSHGGGGTNDIDMLRNPEVWLDDVLEDMRNHREMLIDRITFHPAIIEIDPLGVHYVDRFFGANVFFYKGCVWNDELQCDLSELQMPDIPSSELFRQSYELGKLVTEATQGKVLIAGPVLSCPANIGMNLFGQRLLEALVERPEVARRALRIIADVIITLTRCWLDLIPYEIHQNFVGYGRYTPPGFGEIDGCATQLISAKHYNQFFAPLDEEILQVTKPGGLIHICGSIKQHIPTWGKMKSLRAIQANDRALDDFKLLYTETRPDQILYVVPSENCTLDKILEVTRGNRIILETTIHEPIPIP